MKHRILIPKISNDCPYDLRNEISNVEISVMASDGTSIEDGRESMVRMAYEEAIKEHIPNDAIKYVELIEDVFDDGE